MIKSFKYLFSLLFGLCLVCQISSAVASTAKPAASLDNIVAIVNKSVITQAELNHALIMAKKQLSVAKNPAIFSQKKLRQMTLENLINQKLIVELAKREHVTVSDAKVTQAIANIARQYNLSIAALKTKLALKKMTFVCRAV